VADICQGKKKKERAPKVRYVYRLEEDVGSWALLCWDSRWGWMMGRIAAKLIKHLTYLQVEVG
jgi:hypothetical protein